MHHKSQPQARPPPLHGHRNCFSPVSVPSLFMISPLISYPFPSCLQHGPNRKVIKDDWDRVDVLGIDPSKSLGLPHEIFHRKFHFLSEALRPSEESARNATGSCTFFARPTGLAPKVHLESTVSQVPTLCALQSRRSHRSSWGWSSR